MNSSNHNKFFKCNDQILQIYSSTNLKPGAQEAQIINFYDKNTKQMQPEHLENAITQLTNYSVVEFKSITYIIGGLINESIPSDIIYMFKDYKFQNVSKLPFPLYDCSCAANDQYIVIFGGRNGQSYLNKLLVYDDSFSCKQFPQNQDKQIFDLHYKNQNKNWPIARSQASICCFKQQFFIFGGAGKQIDRELWVLNLEQRLKDIQPVFQKIRYNVGPNPGFGGLLLPYNNMIILVGGKGNENRAYKFRNNNWEDCGWVDYKYGQAGYFDGSVFWTFGKILEIGCM